MALMLMMHALRTGTFAVATVDHGLRGEAADEAAMVAGLCVERGIPHATLGPEHPLEAQPRLPVGQEFLIGGDVNIAILPSSSRANLQARARAARYDLLVAHARSTGCDVVLTAHHRNDQAETFLMRASRGSGVDGLSGVRRSGGWDGFPLYRPLLNWERTALHDVLRAAKVDAIEDPSNLDPTYDRSRFRQLLADAPNLRVDGLVRSAAAVAEASEALGWAADIIARQRVEEGDGTLVVDAATLPREFQRRVLAIALARMGEREPRGPALDGVLEALTKGGRVSLGNLLLDGQVDGRWLLRPAPPRRTN